MSSKKFSVRALVQRTRTTIDPIRFEVVRNALQEHVEGVGIALARSAYSTNIKTRLDYSVAIFDRDARIAVQAFNQASHLGSMVFSVPAAVKNYGVENLHPGDGIAINDSHRGMVHLNDIAIISPLYYKGEIFGYVANIAHHVDVGGKAPGSIAVTTEIYQEGIIIPGVKILKNGDVDKDVFNLILANVRGKKEFGGDIRAQIAANKLAQRRMIDLLERFGDDVVSSVIQELYEYTERRTRLGIDDFPDGEYSAEGYVDDDGVSPDPIAIRAKVRLNRGDINIDLSGSDKQTRGCMNSTYAQSYAACAYAVKVLLPEDIPVNDGFYRAVKVTAPKGSVTNCEYPGAVVGGWETGLKTLETVLRAFSQAIPQKVPAEGKKTLFHIAFGGVDPRDNERYVFLETLGGGYGGRPHKDGEDAVQAHYQNTENSPVEELEKGYPVLMLRYELIEDSEGPGKFRGGLGLRRDYKFTSDETTVTILADTAKIAPRGLFGGDDGKAARFVLNPESSNPVQLSSKSTFMVTPNDIVSLQTPGGGGYGDAFERSPELVLKDVKLEKVSPERARKFYGVVLQWQGRALEVDPTATMGLRSGRASSIH